MDTRGSPEVFPGPTDGSVESLFRLIPSPEEQRQCCQVLERLHPTDARTFLEYLLPYDSFSLPNTRTILTMMTMMSWIVILMCMVVLIYYDDYD